MLVARPHHMNYAGYSRQRTPAMVIYDGPGVAVPQTFAATTYNSGGPIKWITTTTININSVNTTANTMTINGNNGRLWRAEIVKFSSTGTVPAPLVANTEYQVLNPSPAPASAAVTFQVGLLGTTTPIDLTSAGSGTITAQMWMTDRGHRPLINRTLNGNNPPWAEVHTAPGTFDWTRMDAHIDYHFKQRGRMSVLTIYSTPQWAVNPAYQGTPYYAGNGGNHAPDDMSVIDEYVTAAMNRYNKVSAFNPGGQRMIYAIETWNEPSFLPLGTADAYFCGTMTQLAEMTRHMSASAKAADPGILVFGPGFTSGSNNTPYGLTVPSAAAWMVASDGAGGQGKDWIDAHCYHGYDISDVSVDVVPQTIKRTRTMLERAGLPADFPIVQSERGVELGNSPLLFIRAWCIEAALGVKMSVVYTFDGYGILDDFDVRDEFANAADDFYDNVCGKTMTYCARNTDGTVTVVVDGLTYTW